LERAVFNRERKQYVSESLHDPLQQARAAQSYVTEKTVFVGLLDGDIYPESGDWNYMFSHHWPDGISVVANDRMIPSGFMPSSQARILYGERLLKFEIQKEFPTRGFLPMPEKKQSVIIQSSQNCTDVLTDTFFPFQSFSCMSACVDTRRAARKGS